MVVYTLDKVPEIVQFLNEWSSEKQPNESVLLAIVSPPPNGQVSKILNLGRSLQVNVEYSQQSPWSTALKTQPASDLKNCYLSTQSSMTPYEKVNSLLLDGGKHGGRKFQAGAVWAPPLILGQLDEVIKEYSVMLEAYPETAGSAVLFQFGHPAKIASIPNNATAFANRGYHRLAMVEVKFKNASLDAVAVKYAERIMQTVSAPSKTLF